MAIKPTKNIDPTTVGLQTIDGLSGLQFVTNKGNPASIKAKEIGKKGATATSTGFVPLDPNAQYRIINEKGKDRVLYTGTGEEGLKNVYALAQDLSATKGKKANWGVEMFNPATGEWSRVADDDPAKKWTSVVGDVIGTALPIATALVPGLQFLGPVATTALAGGAGAALAGRDPLKGAVMGGLTAAGGSLLGPALQGAGIGANAATALGTGLGTTAGGLATGQNLQNALLGGVASGGLSFLGGEIFGPQGATRPGTDIGQTTAGIGQTVGQQAAQQVAGGLDEIIVQAASRGLTPNFGAITSAIGSSAGNLLMNQIPGSTAGRAPAEPTTNAGEITVTAAPATRFDNLVAAISSGANLGDLIRQGYTEAEIAQGIDTAQSREITVEARPTTPSIPLISPVLPTPSVAPQHTSPVTEGEEVTVTGRENLPPLIPVTVTPAAIAAATTLAGSPVANTVPSQTPPTQTPPASLLDQLAKYTTLAGLAQDLLGSLAGTGSGGGGGRGTTYTPTLGAVPTFSRGAVQPFTGDYERYGFGPEWSFFAQPAAPATTTQAAPAGVLPPTNLFANTATAPYTSLI